MPSNIVDYGTAQQPNLEEISKITRDYLLQYQHLLDNAFLGVDDPVPRESPSFLFQGDFTLKLTPDKTTTARTVLDIFHHQQKIADLYVILFAPGDGTGKEGEYQLNNCGVLGVTAYDTKTGRTVQVPAQYQSEQVKLEHLLPRNKLKEKVLVEACFPLATVEKEFLYPYTISLEQITVDKDNTSSRLVKGLQMGFEDSSYTGLVHDPVTFRFAQADFATRFPTYLTCGYRRNGERFGDPHATFYNPKLAEGHPNRMQVAAFVSVESVDNPLCKVLDRIAIAPESE